MEDRVVVDQFARQYLTNTLLDQVLLKLIVRNVRRVLGREHNGIHALRPVVLIIFDRDLALRIGAEVIDFAALEVAAKRFDEAMRETNRRGHKLRRFVTGKTKHHALIASALLLVEAFAFGNTLRDIRALLA